MTITELSLADNAYQTFEAALNGLQTQWTFRYNGQSKRWYFDLVIDGKDVLTGRRIVLNTNLLGNLAGLGSSLGWLLAIDYQDQGNVPGRYELPSRRVRLYHLTPDEVD